MRQFVIFYLFPSLLSLGFVYFIVINQNQSEPFWIEKPNTTKPDSSFDFIENFNNNINYENQFLRSDQSNEIIYLLGSSELTEVTDAIPYKFISSNYSTKVKAVGHAGNQCFSIFMQLLACHNRLENTPIVFIISPGWFESKTSRGTSSEVFLEFNSERFLKNINSDSADREFQNYAYQRVAHFYSEFNSPNLQLRLMNYKYQSSKSFIHQAFFQPLIIFDNYLVKLKDNIVNQKLSNDNIIRHPIAANNIKINWDSLFQNSKSETAKKCTNNSLGINDEYYTNYIHGKTGHIEPVALNNNQELYDFKMLIKLIKSKNINASFLISPLNPLHFKTLKELSPTISILENELQKNNFPYLNLFEADSTKYEKEILTDIMHLSDYGWFKLDKFIVDTYHLEK